MRREMPTWSTVGMNTRWRPGSEMYARRARALGADRLLGDLDDDLLPLLEQVLDARAAARARRVGGVFVVVIALAASTRPTASA